MAARDNVTQVFCEHVNISVRHTSKHGKVFECAVRPSLARTHQPPLEPSSMAVWARPGWGASMAGRRRRLAPRLGEAWPGASALWRWTRTIRTGARMPRRWTRTIRACTRTIRARTRTPRPSTRTIRTGARTALQWTRLPRTGTRTPRPLTRTPRTGARTIRRGARGMWRRRVAGWPGPVGPWRAGGAPCPAAGAGATP